MDHGAPHGEADDGAEPHLIEESKKDLGPRAGRSGQHVDQSEREEYGHRVVAPRFQFQQRTEVPFEADLAGLEDGKDRRSIR